MVPKHPLGGDESWARLICHQNVTRLPLPQTCNRNRNCWTFVYIMLSFASKFYLLYTLPVVCQSDLSGCTTGTWRSAGQRLQRRRQITRASNEGSRRFHNHRESCYTRAFSWLKVPTSAFTFKTLLRHYAK